MLVLFNIFLDKKLYRIHDVLQIFISSIQYCVLWLIVIHIVKALSIVKLLLELFLPRDVAYFIFS